MIFQRFIFIEHHLIDERDRDILIILIIRI